MKKLLLLFVMLFALPNLASATSGACSYHNGVNCNAVSSAGKVTCNDGWVNSSVSFIDAEECKIKTYCPSIAIGLTCSYETDYASVQSTVDSMRGTQRAIEARSGLLGSSMSTSSTIGQDLLDNCRADISRYNSSVIAQDSCYQRLTELEQEKMNKDIDAINREFLAEDIDNIFILNGNVNGYIQVKMNKYCEEENGTGSKFDMTTEICSESNAAKEVAFDKRFSAEFYRTLNTIPEYKGIADYNVIKSLTRLPANGKKTLDQIIKEKYPDVAKTVKEATDKKNTVSALIPEGSLIRLKGTDDVYIVKYVGTKMFKRLVLSPSVFKSYGHLKWENVKDINQDTMINFEESRLVKVANDSNVYLLFPQGDTGKKLKVSSTALQSYDQDSVYEINAFDRDSYING